MIISDKKISKRKIINQSIGDTWTCWTTHEGLKLFFGIDNKIELVIGGSFEIYFLMDNPIGLRGSEGCKILSYLPNTMLSFSWNVPPDFVETRESDYKTWVIVFLNSIADQKTEVILNHIGWPEDSKWDPVFKYFYRAWDTVLDNLEKIVSKN
jgi:uncharacterized protein YndB with AHSA1/START domain